MTAANRYIEIEKKYLNEDDFVALETETGND